MSRDGGLDHFVLPLTGAVQPLSLTSFRCYNFEIFCPSGNVGNVYTGGSTVDATARPIGPGNFFSAPDIQSGGTSSQYDLSKVYVLGDVGDSVVVTVAKEID